MRLLIVKLGAMGDVLRTTPLLRAFKSQNPKCHITWVVDSSCKEVLRDNPLIDQILVYSAQTLQALKSYTFDLAVNLDKEEEALLTIETAAAKKKMGFGRSEKGALCALDSHSDYAYRLGIDDELKFKLNKKTYQEISFEQLNMTFNKEEYVFHLSEADRKFATENLASLGVRPETAGRPLIGLNTGAGRRFAGKKLPASTLLSLVQLYADRLSAQVLLLGGDDEAEMNKQLAEKSGGKAVNTGSHSISRFAAMVEKCAAVLTGDTTAMHIAVAVKTPVAAYFGSTCAQEIELYGRGSKIVTDIFCAPCYKKICPYKEECMTQMDAERLFSETKKIMNPQTVQR